jgi:hypothetical protein
MAFQITFYPLPENTAFNDGFGLSMEYHHLDAVEFTHDFGKVTLQFTYCRITLKGSDLKKLFELVRMHEAVEVFQIQQGDAASDPAVFQVTTMHRAYC